MYLRRLELKDAPLMLEWMHDPSVTGGLRTDFSSKKISDAEEFIRRSWEDRPFRDRKSSRGCSMLHYG